MSLVSINFIPFIVAFALMVFGRFIPKMIRTWSAAGILLLLFIALLSYFPEVQSIDNAYKEQHGIALEDSHGEEESETHEETSDEEVNHSTEESELMTVNAVTQSIEWIPELGLSLSFYLDGLSLIFGLIVTGIGTIIFFYAGYYFDDDSEQLHFLTIFFAFAGAMLGLVLSGNLITLFMMWELTSITSFLLIGFKGAKSEDARFGAMQALVITGLGGLALIAGVTLLAFISGDVLLGTGFTFDIAQILQADPEAIAAHPLYLATLILLATAAFTKSAQFPFHFWLPGAMSAPTPASAYLHSATMVKAGIYLLLRLYPIMHANELWTSLLVTVGIGTMFIAAVIALSQRDLKGLLAYSTISWLGALVGMIGLPDNHGIEAALVGIIAHALYKAALFLSAGTIDHNTGTRIIDKLGGLRKQMPVIATVVIISGLSMAGLPIFFGFVAKEVLLDAWSESHFVGQQLSYYAILVSAALTGTAAFIFIWDVFFRAPSEEIHFHKSARALSYAPLMLAIGTTIFGFFLDPPFSFVEDIIVTGVPKAINIHLLPSSLTNPLFLTSLAVVTSGFIVFLLRNFWLPILSKIPVPRASNIYQAILNLIDWIGDQVLKTQNGQVRYYLAVILGTVSLTLLTTGGIVADLSAGQSLQFSMGDFDAATILRAILLLLMIVASIYTVFARRHLNAVLALAVLGYAVGGLFLLEPAPDVSLVQFLIETLATILVVIMLGRINDEQRWDVIKKLWKGRSNFRGFNLGIIRDILIAATVGLAVFFFVLTALVNRPDRESITQYHLDNTYEQIHIEDVVGAIVADYRGLDTFVEVIVFSVVALGVLTILTRGMEQINPFAPNPKSVKMQAEFQESAREGLQDATSLNTPFTRIVARLVLPVSFLIALSHIINGGHGPGDGFTAGSIAGLATALWFVVFGYKETKERLSLLAPHRLIRAGLIIIIINAILPIIVDLRGGLFLAHVDYGKILGINDLLSRFGLELTSGLFFEISIALVVFGGISIIMEAIAHPAEILDIDYDPRTTGEFRQIDD